MKNSELRKIARKLQAEQRDKIDEAYRLVIHSLQTYSNINENTPQEPIRRIFKDLKKCKSVRFKVPVINKGTIDETLYQNNVGRYIRSEIIRLLKTRVPTIDFIFKDLLQLKKEFKEIIYEYDTLSVVTSDIILSGINLGPFKIPKPVYTGELCVEVVALRPNYPPGETGYTHPHVEFGTLCTGYGHTVLLSAPRNARILDYFQIVDTILNTYGKNPHILHM